MIYKSGLEVIMGCGHPEYDNNGKPAGIIKEYTGISAPYEEPENAEITLNTHSESAEECADKILRYLAILLIGRMLQHVQQYRHYAFPYPAL